MSFSKFPVRGDLSRRIIANTLRISALVILSFSLLELGKVYFNSRQDYRLNGNISSAQTVNSQKSTASVSKPQLNLTDYNSLINKDEPSVVKIEGENGCPDIIFGTGFVVAPDLVATNAHVVAGISNPVIIDNSGRHVGTPVFFDPELDFAVIRVPDLTDSPLPLNYNGSSMAIQGEHDGDQDVVLGYPNAGNFKPVMATITDELDVFENDIYDKPYDSQDVLELNSDIVHGNSGSPIIQHNGQVAGIIYAISSTDSSLAYGIPTNEFFADIQQAENTYTPVNTQSCIQEADQ